MDQKAARDHLCHRPGTINKKQTLSRTLRCWPARVAKQPRTQGKVLVYC